MSVDGIIQTQAHEIEEKISHYEDLIKDLPKGTVICRKNIYYYLKYREDGIIRDKYLGKDSPEIGELREKINKRKHYEKMLFALRKEQKKIEKVIEILEIKKGSPSKADYVELDGDIIEIIDVDFTDID